MAQALRLVLSAEGKILLHGSGAGSSTPDTSSAGYADGSLGTGLAPKSRAKARALALTQPPVTPGPGRHNRLEEVPEETPSIEIELCLAEHPAPSSTRVQILPPWVIVDESEERDFKPQVVARYRRLVYQLHEQWLAEGEYFNHLAERERAFQDWLDRNGGDPRGGP